MAERVKPGYYFYVLCVNCGKEIIFARAPSPQEEETPEIMRGMSLQCPHCGEEHTYYQMGRGEVAEEK
jgi:DNA-directed RNA polymerase subunit RPC12/RpoP